MPNSINSNTLFTLFLKALRNFKYIFHRFGLSLEVKKLGKNCKVLGGVIISGGKNINIGNNCFIGRNVFFDASSGEIIIGDNVEIRDGVRIYGGKIKIGNSVSLCEYVFIHGNVEIKPKAWIARGCDLGGEVLIEKAILGPKVACIGAIGHLRNPENQELMMSLKGLEDKFIPKENPLITICGGSWIGYGSIILKGVTINKKMIVAAGSVVTKTFPELTTVAGIPAKPIDKAINQGVEKKLYE